MSVKDLALDNTFWIERHVYDEAERLFHEKRSNQVCLAPLAAEVAKARQRICQMKQNISNSTSGMEDVLKAINDRLQGFDNAIQKLQDEVARLSKQMGSLQVVCEKKSTSAAPSKAPAKKDDEDDDDVDLFGSESDEDDAAAAKIKEERLAAYNAKKSKKPALIAKSSIILDVKPWDDETDMKALEAEVRKVSCDGLLWGASKLVPLAYGIYKLQINCVIEDEKVSVDWLQEQIESVEDFVQSVDVAAFNKI